MLTQCSTSAAALRAYTVPFATEQCMACSALLYLHRRESATTSRTAVWSVLSNQSHEEDEGKMTLRGASFSWRGCRRCKCQSRLSHVDCENICLNFGETYYLRPQCQKSKKTEGKGSALLWNFCNRVAAEKSWHSRRFESLRPKTVTNQWTVDFENIF